MKFRFSPETEAKNDSRRVEREAAKKEKQELLAQYGFTTEYSGAMGKLIYTDSETKERMVSDIEAHSFDVMKLNGSEDIVVVATTGAMSHLVNPKTLDYCTVAAMNVEEEDDLKEDAEHGFHSITHLSGNQFEGQTGAIKMRFYVPELQP